MITQLFLYACLLVSFQPTRALANEATIWEQISDRTRPFLEKVLGEDKTKSLLGEKKVELPTIPGTKADPKSLESLEGTKVDENKKAYKNKDLDALFLQELFLVVRGSEISTTELGTWLNVLGQGGSREGVYRAISSDEQYRTLESSGPKASPKVLAFTKKFMETYLALTVEEKNLKNSGFYTLKKILTDKALETVDAFTKEPAKLADWYGVLSADFAKEYPQLWNGKIRKDSRAMVHRDWAAQVPVQHLKSEVIIKLQKVYDSLK